MKTKRAAWLNGFASIEIAFTQMGRSSKRLDQLLQTFWLHTIAFIHQEQRTTFHQLYFNTREMPKLLRVIQNKVLDFFQLTTECIFIAGSRCHKVFRAQWKCNYIFEYIWIILSWWHNNCFTFDWFASRWTKFCWVIASWPFFPSVCLYFTLSGCPCHCLILPVSDWVRGEFNDLILTV